jgi:hypothetical protein
MTHLSLDQVRKKRRILPIKRCIIVMKKEQVLYFLVLCKGVRKRSLENKNCKNKSRILYSWWNIQVIIAICFFCFCYVWYCDWPWSHLEPKGGLNQRVQERTSSVQTFHWVKFVFKRECLPQPKLLSHLQPKGGLNQRLQERTSSIQTFHCVKFVFKSECLPQLKLLSHLQLSSSSWCRTRWIIVVRSENAQESSGSGNSFIETTGFTFSTGLSTPETWMSKKQGKLVG